MSLAADTREAARARPFVLDALRAGVLNHSAAAAWLADEADLGDGNGDADTDAIATALRRFREELPDYGTAERAASVSMRSGVGVVDDDGGDVDGSDADPLLRVGGAAVTPAGRDTAILATGAVDAAALAAVLRRLAVADVVVEAAGVAGETLVVVVGRRDGATAVRVAEAALAAVPTDGE
ncbi:DUF7523 family protein [Halorubrum lipolyticum]|uniref:Uncharacterized protein n=1 Tax=Halorubrum lipolyticum DSM 21995 TaxID=1227482 RepID=M0NV27_9EURY|nr:hypothetical protein [Halorubrum lipolyticum]EMA61099.1 hypothetical protein C469_07507 [Halorubrum lipolyticum DSM 21995]